MRPNRPMLALVVLLAAGAAGAAHAIDPTPPSSQLLAAVENPQLRLLLEDVLERNPEIAAARAEAAAAAQIPAQAGALPDPMAALTLYLSQPETRVGPQWAMATASQRFPWPGTLKLREQAALDEALAALARVEALRLDKLTRARTLYYDLAFLETQSAIVREDRETLEHFDELSRARYASGVGLEQAVIKIQAEITRAEAKLLDIATQRARVVSQLNALRDRVESAPVTGLTVPVYPELDAAFADLRRLALESRPEMAAARARASAAERRIALAQKAYQPELSAGVTYTVVGERDDMDMPDNGRDILGVTGGMSLPIWRGKLEAGLEEAVQRRLAADERVRSTIVDIEQSLADLERRIPLIGDRLELFERVLVPQAEAAVDSALAAYSAGTVDAISLLDSERVLLEVRVAAARARTDYAVAVAELERAVAAPLATVASHDPADPAALEESHE